MKLEGIHHVTAITADAPGNVDFYARVLGLRLVKKSVNQDDPTVYHLFYGDERGDPGADITFFEYPGARRGNAGAGMVHRIAWRVASEHELLVVETTDEPLVADHPEVPKELALQGFDSVRAYAFDPEQSRHFLEQTLEFSPNDEDAWEVRGEQRGSFYRY